MEANIFGILAPIITEWNAHNYFKLAITEDEAGIVISPVNSDNTAHIPGSILRDVAMLSDVYDFCLGIHSRNNVPYILI